MRFAVCLAVCLGLVGGSMGPASFADPIPESAPIPVRASLETFADFTPNASDDRMRTPVELRQYGANPAPAVRDGFLRLLDDTNGATNTATFPRTAPGMYREIDATFRMRIRPGADGFAFALLPTTSFGNAGHAPALAAWEEPNIAGAFAVGFDIHNPPSRDWFDANGNFYGRPEREISLHWNGIEVANVLAPAEFRSGEWVTVAIAVRSVIGGAGISVRLDDAPVYDRQFIAFMVPYESRAAFGARTGGMSTVLDLDDIRVNWRHPIAESPAEPVRVRTFERQIVTPNEQRPTAEFELPMIDGPIGRLICSITLDRTPAGIDGWDRGAAVFVFDGEEKYEIVRYITPFGRGYTWHVDVTDYQSLLQGKRKLGLQIDTWQIGWAVTVDFAYFGGLPDREAFKIVKVWAGAWEYGNPDAPLDAHFVPQTIAVPEGATGAKLKLTVTGHGMHPATANAGEFMPADRTVTVNGAEFRDRLWRTDVYLNPCRPQGGTWKFDRAGWAPGDIVRPWFIDLTRHTKPGESLRIAYVPMPYVNEKRAEARASHWVEVHLIFYREPEREG